jgi:hypothetical protein
MGKILIEAEPRITRVIPYVKDIPSVAAFYERFFGMRPLPAGAVEWFELTSCTGGCTIAPIRRARRKKAEPL